MRDAKRRITISITAIVCTAASAAASAEINYTYLDFQYIEQRLDASGVQPTPGAGQTVAVQTKQGDGISAAGSLAIGDKFYFGGSFQSAVVDVDGVVTNEFGVTPVADNFDLVLSRVVFGYQHGFGRNLDLVAELSYDSANYDFGSFAGESFDMKDAGVGASAGLRWNPTPALELSLAGRFTPVGKAQLDTLQLDSDTLVSVGAMWHFLQDLGIGLTYESGGVDTLTVSMRFSFGNLPW